jgi:hypothetical protein
MNKILVLAVALSIVFGSGAYFAAQAGSDVYPAIQSPAVYGCVSCKAPTERDFDLASIPGGFRGNNEWERDMYNGPISPY